MPWGPKDAVKHTKKATTTVAQRQWADVANGVLKRTGDEARAIRSANATVGRRKKAK